MIGPGKYDDEATLVRERTQAQTVIVLVGGGSKGDGFSVQCTDRTWLLMLPGVLRQIADAIEKDMGN